MTTVRDLREIAEGILDQISGMDYDTRIVTRTNTFRMDNVLETYDGFIDYTNIKFDYSDEYDESYSIKPAVVRPVVRNSINPNKRPPTPKKKPEVKRTADRKAAPKKTTKRTTVKTAPTRNKAAPKRSVSNGVRR